MDVLTTEERTRRVLDEVAAFIDRVFDTMVAQGWSVAVPMRVAAENDETDAIAGEITVHPRESDPRR